MGDGRPRCRVEPHRGGHIAPVKPSPMQEKWIKIKIKPADLWLVAKIHTARVVADGRSENCYVEMIETGPFICDTFLGMEDPSVRPDAG